jgi:hypothetical protein
MSSQRELPAGFGAVAPPEPDEPPTENDGFGREGADSDGVDIDGALMDGAETEGAETEGADMLGGETLGMVGAVIDTDTGENPDGGEGGACAGAGAEPASAARPAIPPRITIVYSLGPAAGARGDAITFDSACSVNPFHPAGGAGGGAGAGGLGAAGVALSNPPKGKSCPVRIGSGAGVLLGGGGVGGTEPT